MKRWLYNFLLLFFSLIISISLAEYASRLIFYIPSGMRMLSMDGKIIRGSSLLTPGLKFRLKSIDYDSVTTITDMGYRVPEARGNPDIIFLGDSFTYGVGLNDKETFVYIYCKKLNLSCVNLGMSGSGTTLQLNRLERYLKKYNWKPRKVKLFIFAMTDFLSHGNDLSDILRESKRLESQKNEILPHKVKHTKREPNLLEKLYNEAIKNRNLLDKHSNLVRILYFLIGNNLRSFFVPQTKKEIVKHALNLMKEQLMRLDRMSKNYGFEYSIYLFHPVQDIIRGTYLETLEAMREISPTPIYDTAHLFLDNPKRYYYKSDAHFNPAGSKKIAEFLISTHKEK